MTDPLRPVATRGDESREDVSSFQQSPSRGEESSNPATRPSLNLNTQQPEGASLNTNADFPPGHGLHRFDTLPIRRGTSANRQDEIYPDTRRRGRTISSRPRDAPPLSPRSQLFARNPSNAGSRTAEDRMGSIPEGGRGSADIGSRGPRRSNTSVDRGLSSSGLRPRVSTVTRPRASTLNRRPSIAVAAVASGRDQDGQSLANFSMAGPSPIDTVAANQPYVDPGYSQLNPAYEQPVNVRPVWGLAKPLPRVIRPGMVPTRSEINLQPPAAEQPVQDSANVDVEQGRIEPTLRLNKISSQLQNTREQRENNLLRTFSRTGAPPISNSGRDPSGIAGPLSPASQAIAEEDDMGLQPLDLVKADQPGYGKQQEQTTPENQWFPDDAASAVTEHEQEGDLDGDILHEDIPLPAYDAEADEIHNLHTHWSVIRLRFREPLAELLAVTVQLTLGFCADLTVTCSNSKSGNEETTDWAWGLASMVAIYIAGGISGAHLNPAISIMLYIYRGFPLRKVPVYMLAQIVGAFLAALIAFGLFKTNILEYGGADLKNGGTLSSFITFPRYTWIDAATAFFTEFTGTAILAIAALALGDDTNAPPGAGMNAFILGLVVTVLSMAFGYNTGAAMNPSRDLGPRLAVMALGYGTQVFKNGYWIYGPWVATITGAIFGAFLYDAAIFVGGESPVNYPRRRIKRAGHKWKKRWGARLKGYKRRVKYRGEINDGLGDGDKMNAKGSL